MSKLQEYVHCNVLQKFDKSVQIGVEICECNRCELNEVHIVKRSCVKIQFAKLTNEIKIMYMLFTSFHLWHFQLQKLSIPYYTKRKHRYSVMEMKDINISRMD
jgi:hypothetical protein